MSVLHVRHCVTVIHVTETSLSNSQ